MHAKLDESATLKEMLFSQKKDTICSGGAASSEAFVTKLAQWHCILGDAHPHIGVICNSKILQNKMCCFAFFWLLKICIVDAIIAHVIL